MNDKINIGKVILWIVIVIFLITIITLSLVFNLFSESPGMGSNSLDRCKPEPGYTEKEWREHMSHHPNEYKECLGG